MNAHRSLDLSHSRAHWNDAQQRAHACKPVSLSLCQGALWMDFFMWSVLMGQFELSRKLWLKAEAPMRAALIAKRLCDKMKVTAGDEYASELSQQSQLFEIWALGMLDEVPNTKEAIDILTRLPIRYKLLDSDSKRECHIVGSLAKELGHSFGSLGSPSSEKPPNTYTKVPLWPGSVLDEASCLPHPCRVFVAHRHCNQLVDCYWCGNYRGSKACFAPTVTFTKVIVEILVHLAVFVPYVLLGRTHLSTISIEKPKHSSLDEFEEAERNSDLKNVLDVDYFQKARNAHADASDEEVSALRFWQAFFNIPKVKFVLYAISQLVSIVLLAVWLCQDFPSSEAHSFGLDGGQDLKWYPQWTLEILFWIYYAGRTQEEIFQIQRWGFSAYVSSWWNKVDVLLTVITSIAAALRLYAITYLIPCVADAIATTSEAHRADLESQGCTYRNYQSISQLVRDFLVMSMLLLSFRYIEILTIVPAFSEVWLIFVAMVEDSGPVITMMALFVTTTGECFSNTICTLLHTCSTQPSHG